MANISLIGLHSDETAVYHSPLEPKAGDVVKIRFRTLKDDVDQVVMVWKRTVSRNKKHRAQGEDTAEAFVLRDADKEHKIILEKELSTDKKADAEVFDYYKTEIVAEDETIRYYFEVYKGNEKIIYNRRGAFNDTRTQYQFAIVPGFETPDWAKGAVMYQIYTDRFCNGDSGNDVQTNEYYYINGTVKRIEDWNKTPATLDVGNFYGGDLQGVWDKLDYLQGLGVEVLYFNPLFVSPSNHKYDCQDYEHIDPHLTVIKNDGGEVLPEGCKDNKQASKYITRTANLENLEASNEYFARFCQELHRRGMKIIIDGVFNHSGSFNKWMDRERIYEKQEGFAKGAYVDKESPYHTFYQFYKDEWPYNKSYDSWWANDTLPKMNYESSPKLEEYIIEIGKKWVSPPYCVDGWRLDVAADLGHSPEYNHKFWRKFRKAVKEVNPEVMIYAEHYGDASSWMQGDQWDTVMNYDAFMEPLTWFLTGMEKHSDSYNGDYYRNSKFFRDSMSHHMTAFHMPSLMTAMNQLSNHDHSRFLTRTNQVAGRLAGKGAEAANQDVKKYIMAIAVAFQMTWIGAPTLYYGDEAGVCGFTDPDSRRTYPWGREDFNMIEFHRDMIALHRRNQVLKTGSTKILLAENQVFAYARFDEESQVVVAINLSDEEKKFSLPVWTANVPVNCHMHRVMKVTNDFYNVGQSKYTVKDGMLDLRLDSMSCKIIQSI